MINGTELRVIEMDNMSLSLCEQYPADFPLMDFDRVIKKVLVRYMLCVGIHTYIYIYIYIYVIYICIYIIYANIYI